jgi:hypothetical protein
MKIGFAIVSHSEPDQLLRLVTTLTALYGEPPIACHHDFTRAPCNTHRFPSNTKFVRPHKKTAWGHISLPRAMLSALRLLRESAQPDWVVLLSGSDYPVRRPELVLEELQDSRYDAYLDHREIRHGFMPPGQTAQSGFARPSYIDVALVRYYYHMVWLPHPKRAALAGISMSEAMRRISRRENWTRYLVLKSELINRLVRPLREPPRVFAGDVWFEAKVKVVDRLLDPSVASLDEYFRKRFVPEEAIFQTLLCNQADLHISPDSKRYSDWSAGGAHPKWFAESDVPGMLASNAHFARKFHSDGRTADLVDRLLLSDRAMSGYETVWKEA